jgi:integrase/recombinase XerD
MVRTVSLAMKDWPEADRLMWARLVAAAGPLDGNGALSHLRATSLTSLQSGYERWIWWVLREYPGSRQEAPEVRATPVRLLAWVTALNHLAPDTRLTLVIRTVRILSASAPELDWSVQRHLLHRLDRAARNSHSKRKIGRVLPSHTLLAAGQTMASTVAQDQTTVLAASLALRDGAMVALLSLLPMRLRSLTELQLAVSVHVTSGQILITLSPEMTKNGRTWEAAVPAAAAEILRRYMDVARPWLVTRGGQNHGALWVGCRGEPMKASAIAKRVSMATSKMTGIRVSPHIFRDSAASTLARRSPQNARLIRPLLAHASFGTAERHYVQAQGIETGRDYAAVLARLMEED